MAGLAVSEAVEPAVRAWHDARLRAACGLVGWYAA